METVQKGHFDSLKREKLVMWMLEVLILTFFSLDSSFLVVRTFEFPLENQEFSSGPHGSHTLATGNPFRKHPVVRHHVSLFGSKSRFFPFFCFFPFFPFFPFFWFFSFFLDFRIDFSFDFFIDFFIDFSFIFSFKI